MALLEMLASSGIGAALGTIGGIGEKWLMRRLDAKDKAAEREHVVKMHGLQMQSDQIKHSNDLYRDELKGSYTGLSESLKHDSALKMTAVPDKLLETHPKLAGFAVFLQTIANFIRTLFRPFLTALLWYLAYKANYSSELLVVATTCTVWWFGSRNGGPLVRKIRNAS